MSASRGDRLTTRARRGSTALALLSLSTLALAPTRVASAQGTLEKLALDRLQLTGLGVVVAPIAIAQVDATQLVGVTADYGLIEKRTRATFGVTFWQSHLRSDVVQAFADSLQHSVNDPNGQATVTPSPVSIYDITFSGGIRYSLSPEKVTVHPYVDAGMAAHVINAEGKLIDGTFVERALDAISAGFYAGFGVELRPTTSFTLDAQVRGDLLSGFRSGQIRVGAMYYLGPPRRQP